MADINSGTEDTEGKDEDEPKAKRPKTVEEVIDECIAAGYIEVVPPEPEPEPEPEPKAVAPKAVESSPKGDDDDDDEEPKSPSYDVCARCVGELPCDSLHARALKDPNWTYDKRVGGCPWGDEGCPHHPTLFNH